MFKKAFGLLFPCCLIFLFASVQSASAQTPTTSVSPVPVATPPIAVFRKGTATALRVAMIQDKDAEEDEFSYYLPIEKEEIIKIDIPDCGEPKWDEGSKTETTVCYRLVSSNPAVVSVLNSKFLIGMAKRGEASITVQEYILERQITNRGAENEERSAFVEQPKPKLMGIPLGRGFEVLEKIPIRVNSRVDKQIIAVPSLKTYQAVSDSYGKGIAKKYLVVAVDIINNNANKQYLIQNVSISFDPNQCNNLADVWGNVYAGGTTLRLKEPEKTDENGKKYRETKNEKGGVYRTQNDIKTETFTPDSERNVCLANYKRYFYFPATIMPTDGNTMLAVAESEKYRSRRYQLFQAMKFAADVGGGLTAFKILGRDGITGFNFLGGTLFNSADKALPRVSDQKLQNLGKDSPKPNVIVKGNDYQTVNIFIPAHHVLSNEAWEKYRNSRGDMKNIDAEFVRYMLLFLVANSNGILIDENSKQVESEQGGGAVKSKAQ